MTEKVQEQSANYHLADLKPMLEKSSTNNAILNSSPIWLSAQTTKSAGRGRSADNTHQYGVQKLRELILELAVRGKLVPQDPNDEPASILLEKIAEEKARLVKEGKIKKPKTLSITEDDRKIHTIPKSWETDCLGNLSHIITKGTTPTSIGYSFQSSGVNFIKIENISNGRINLSSINQFVSDETHNALGRSKLEVNDILFSIAGTIGKTAVVNQVDLPANTNQALAIIKGTGSIFNPSYLKIQLDSFVSETVRNKARGGAMPNISLGDLQNLIALIPPIPEQHRIVKKVDELMALCDKLEQQQADGVQAHDTLVKVLLDTLTQSDNADDFQQSWQRITEHFDTLFTTEYSIDQLKQTLLQLAVMGKLVPQDPNDQPASVLLKKIADEKSRLVDEGIIKKSKKLPAISEDEQVFSLPNGWAWTRLETLFNVIVDCPHSTPKFKDSGKLCIDTNSFKDGMLLKHKLRYVSDETFESRNSRLVPEYRDIVFAREGSVGESVVIPANLECCLGQRVMLFRPSGTLNPDFLRLTLSSEIALKTLLALHKGIGAKHVNVGDMRKYVVACPPSNEQHRIVKKVDELMALCDQLKDRLNQAKTLQQQLADAVSRTAFEERISEVIDLESYRSGVASYIIKSQHQQETFGRTKLMKSLSLVQNHVGIDMSLSLAREAAGPLDRWIYAFEENAQLNNWLNVKTTKLKSGNDKVTYEVSKGVNDVANYFTSNCPTSQQQELKRLIKLFENLKTEDVEIIATLYCAWNDFLIDGVNPTDDLVIKEVRENWHESKARFTSVQLSQWIAWMRKNSLVPTGKGTRTVQQQKLV